MYTSTISSNEQDDHRYSHQKSQPSQAWLLRSEAGHSGKTEWMLMVFCLFSFFSWTSWFSSWHLGCNDSWLFLVSQLRGGVRIIFSLCHADCFVVWVMSTSPLFSPTSDIVPIHIWGMFPYSYCITHMYSCTSVHVLTGRHNIDIVPIHVWVHVLTSISSVSILLNHGVSATSPSSSINIILHLSRNPAISMFN